MNRPALRIRRGTPSDAAALAEFAARTFSDTYGAVNDPAHLEAHLDTAYGMAQQGRELSDPDWVSLLAESETGLAGYAQVRCHSPPDCVTGPAPFEVARFYVDHPWQGQGLAGRLMREVGSVIRALGGQTVWLGVWERNPRAIAFYAKCGFQDAGAADFFVGPDRQSDRIMVAPAARLAAPGPARQL